MQIRSSRARVAFGALLLSLALVEQAAAQTAPASPPEVSDAELELLRQSADADAATAPPDPAASSVAAVVQSLNPDVAVIASVGVAAFHGDEPLQLGGHDLGGNGFSLQQLELAMGASVDPFFRFDANLAFAVEGVEIEEAYATTLALPASLQARAGQFLTRFGRHNPTHLHAWSFADQPLVLGKMFGSEGHRGLGVEVSWLAPTPWFVELVAAVNGAAGECCARTFRGGDGVRVRDAGDLVYTSALKQFFALGDDWSLLAGVSGQAGRSDARRRAAIYGADLLLRWRPVGDQDRTSVSLQIEGLTRRRKVPSRVLRDHGGYAQLVWRIDPALELGARHELVTGIVDDPLDPDWSEEAQRSSVQLSYLPSHFSRVRAQASYGRRAFRDEPVIAVFLSLEVIAGAHGAHTY